MTLGASSPAPAPAHRASDPPLDVWEVLKEEYAALSQRFAPATDASPWLLAADDLIHSPVTLADRVCYRQTPFAKQLREAEALTAEVNAVSGALDAAYRSPSAATDLALRKALAALFNRVITEDLAWQWAHLADPLDPDITALLDEVDCRMELRRRCNRRIVETAYTELPRAATVQLTAVYKAVRREWSSTGGPSALVFSGGGIRSATFALGIVQGLAQHGWLTCVDYLSTVSGGGYLGSWLSAWMARDPLGRAGVITSLAGGPRAPLEPEAEPVRHLRAYSNYLSPRRGLMTADTWTLVATYVRNLLVNWLTLIPFIAALATVPYVVLAALLVSPGPRAVAIAVGVATAGYVFGLAYITAARPDSPNVEQSSSPAPRAHLVWRGLFPLGAASLASVLAWRWEVSQSGFPVLPDLRWWWWVAGGVAINVVAWSLGMVYAWVDAFRMLKWNIGKVQAYVAQRRKERPTFRYQRFIAIPVTGAVSGGLAYRASRTVGTLMQAHGSHDRLFATIGVAIPFAIMALSGTLFAAIVSHRTDDDLREWWARIGARFSIIAAVWVMVFWIVLEGSQLLGQLPGLIAAGGLGTIGVVLRAKSALTPATPNAVSGAPARGMTFDRLLIIISIVALLFVLALVALGVDTATTAIGRAVEGVSPPFLPLPLTALGTTTAVLAVLLGLTTLALLTVDVNRFSLHAMYRARLIRAYLGASRRSGERRPNPISGFDAKDNICMGELWPRTSPASRPNDWRPPPLHVVNATLNLVAGTDLAWQERKAESFTFTALHAGAPTVGYRPTVDYGGDAGVSLGTAMAISGAAASPNMGYHSSPSVTALMALFNARLGWWLGNPRDRSPKTWRRSDPPWYSAVLLRELLGLTSDRKPYVYLSDGGHFENIGLYEMVRRRCGVLVVIDAPEDPKSLGMDLGEAVRKVRIDFGVPIVFRDYAVGNGRCFAIGRVKYSCADGDQVPDGLLLYIKTEVATAAPRDIVSYHGGNTAFPNDSTAEQWYSESQFESYRELGMAAVTQVCAACKGSGVRLSQEDRGDLRRIESVMTGGHASPTVADSGAPSLRRVS